MSGAGRKVVVTGGAGFLGSHVADALADAGYQVTVFDREPSRWLRAGQTMATGDLLDAELMTQVCEGAHAIYHFAGIADIGGAGRDPVLTTRVNVLGTVQLAEIALKAGIERFVFASTVYVYSDHGGFYRASKQAAERFLETFAQERGLGFTILRYGTLYGPRAGMTNRVHAMIANAMGDKKIDYPGDGRALRDYIHVRDAAALSVQILDPAYEGRHLQITGQERLEVRDIAAMISEILPFEVEVKFRDGEPPGHYQLTPFKFTPKPGHKLVPNDYVEIGQGLYECIEEIYNAMDPDDRAHVAWSARKG